MNTDREQFHEEHRLLVQELNKAGFSVQTLEQWIHIPGAPYLSARPILVEFLRKAQNETMLEILVRSMTVKTFAGQDLSRILINKFREVQSGDVRWVIGHALNTLGFKEYLSEILELVKDPAYGNGRQFIVNKLGSYPAEKILPVVTKLVDDPDVDAFAVMAIGRRGGEKELKMLEDIAGKGLDASGWNAILKKNRDNKYNITRAELIASGHRSPLFVREVPKAIKRIKKRLAKEKKNA